MSEWDTTIQKLKDDESPLWDNVPQYEEAFRRGAAHSAHRVLELEKALAVAVEHIQKIVDFVDKDVTLEVYKEIVRHESVDILAALADGPRLLPCGKCEMLGDAAPCDECYYKLHGKPTRAQQDPDPDLDRDELTRRAARWHYQKSGEHSPDGPARWLSSEVADFAIEFAREVAANDEMPDDWKRRCYLLSWELRNVHNPSVCDETNANEDCDTCAYLCEILGELGDWTPEEDAERAIPPPYSGKGADNKSP